MAGLTAFWIIDTGRIMSLVKGEDRTAAIDHFNDKNLRRADMTIPALECACGKYLSPLLPEWMTPAIATPGVICNRDHSKPITDNIDNNKKPFSWQNKFGFCTLGTPCCAMYWAL